MLRRTRLLTQILALGTAIVLADFAWGPHARLWPGRRLPSIELGGAHDSHVNLSAYSGKVILLDFFASW